MLLILHNYCNGTLNLFFNLNCQILSNSIQTIVGTLTASQIIDNKKLDNTIHNIVIVTVIMST